MTARTSLITDSAALISSVKSLENQKNNLNQQIEQAKAKLEQQKLEAQYLSQLMKLDTLPDIDATSNKVNDLKDEISKMHKKQEELREKSKQIQEQIDFSIKARDEQAQAEIIQKDISKLQDQINVELQKQRDLSLRRSDISSDLLKVQLRKKAIIEKLNSELPEKPDINSLEKKTELLAEQIKLMKEKRNAFEQELEEAAINLENALDRHKQIQEIIDKISKENASDQAQSILNMAADNMELRQYAIPRGAERDIRDGEKLYKLCQESIERGNLAFNS